MHSILLVIHILVSATLIGLVLIQRGKGAEVGAAFGSGASNTVFGSRGSASFLTRATAILAVLFFVLTGLLAFTSTQKRDINSVTDLVAPAAPAIKSGAASTPVTPPTKPGDVPVVPEK